MSSPKMPEPGRTHPVIDFARNRAEELAELQTRTRELVAACLSRGQPPDPVQLRKLGLDGQRRFYRALVQALRGEIEPASAAPPPTRRPPRTEAIRPRLISTRDWAERRRHRVMLADRTMLEAGLFMVLLTGLAALSFHLVPLP